MDRKQFEQLLPDYVENNLSGRDLAGVNSWLNDHPGDRKEVSALRELILEVSDVEVPDPGSEFWAGFLPDLRTRMEARAENVGLVERLRRVLIRPAIISSFALASVILALLVLYSNIGPRGEAVMEARQLNSRLEAALRGTENDTLAVLEDYFDQQSRKNSGGLSAFSAELTIAVAGSENGNEAWLDSWLEREDTGRPVMGDKETYRLLGALDPEESNRLQELLRAEMATGEA